MNGEDKIRNEITVEGLNEKEAKEFKVLLKKFVCSYSAKSSEVGDKKWLAEELKNELPNISEKEAFAMATEAVESIAEYDKNLASINNACSRGQNKEQWFVEKLSQVSTGISVINYGNYLKSIDISISNANAQMLRTITTNSGEISKSFNLDGFIAEQHHVNQFNMQATLAKSKFVAEVCVPQAGKTYGLNSFDSVIKDSVNGKIIHQYQFKFGSDAKSTIRLLQDGNYDNQRIVVPVEQVDEVRKAFPGKTIEAYLGGTDKCSIKSEGISKQQVKDLQLKTQQDNVVPVSNWNNFTTRDLALNLGRQAGIAGLQAATMTMGFTLAAQVMSREKIDRDVFIETALTTGADAGIKAATAGALKVGIERGILNIIPKSTPIGIVANIACVGIENIKILAKVATGEMTMAESLDRMGRTTTSMIYGIGWGSSGMILGAATLAWIPIVGPIVGSLAGGMLGYMAGSKFGSAIYSGLKTVCSGAKSLVKSAWSATKSVGSSIKRAIFG